jgi:hypothetical protein
LQLSHVRVERADDVRSELARELTCVRDGGNELAELDEAVSVEASGVDRGDVVGLSIAWSLGLVANVIR